MQFPKYLRISFYQIHNSPTTALCYDGKSQLPVFSWEKQSWTIEDIADILIFV